MTCWGSDTGHLARENKQVRPSAVKQEQPQFHRPWSSQAASTTLISVRGDSTAGHKQSTRFLKFAAVEFLLQRHSAGPHTQPVLVSLSSRLGNLSCLKFFGR